MGKEKLTKQPEIMAAIIGVIGTIVGTLLISVLLGFLEGRIAMGTVVGVVALLLLISIWVLLAIRWGLRLAGAAAAVMVIVGSAVFLIVTAARLIPIGLPAATAVAIAPSPTVAATPLAAAPTATEAIPTATPAVATASPLVVAPTETPAIAPTSTALLSPAEQARAFAEPILAAIADRPPAYEDDFSDPGSGWPIGSAADGDEWGYEDNAYFISATYLPQTDKCTGASPPAPWFSDFVLEIDAQFVSGEWGFWYMIFRDFPGTLEQPVNAHYGVGFWPDGALGWYKDVGRVGTEFVGHPVYASTFERETGTNRLTIIGQGPRIAVYVNGEPLWFVYDESSSKGAILLGVENPTPNTTLRVHFDNLKVWDISDLSP